jgi:DNA-3-methyladenine glycosylase
MWGEAGHAYVYMIYGVHHCLNLVTRGGGAGEAVLLRSATPVVGHQLIRRRRGPRAAAAGELCSGPGRLCQALAVDRNDDGRDVCAPRSRLTVREDAFAAGEEDVRRLPRVGVGSAGEAAEWPLRFVLVTSSGQK